MLGKNKIIFNRALKVKVEANNAMITPIWENFISEVKNGNIQKSDATTDQESTGQTEVVSGSEAEDQLQETSRFFGASALR